MQETQETRVPSLIRKIPWSKKCQPTSVFLPGRPHGPGAWHVLGSQRAGHHRAVSTQSIYRLCVLFSHSVMSNSWRLHGLWPTRFLSRQQYWSGLSFPSPGDLPDPDFEIGSSEFQADFLVSESPEAVVFLISVCARYPLMKLETSHLIQPAKYLSVFTPHYLCA